MPTLIIETFIAASPERVFDLARDVGAHVLTARFTGERAIAPGKTSGLLEHGDLVVFEAVHLGVRQRLSARIVELERPRRFADEQVSGVFKRLRHVHEFEPRSGGTLMRDTLEWSSPFGILGRIADRLLVERHLRWFLVEKQRALKSLAEERQPSVTGPKTGSP